MIRSLLVLSMAMFVLSQAPVLAQGPAPASAPAPSGWLGPTPEFKGVMAWINPDAGQVVRFVQLGVKHARVMSGFWGEMTALRIELVNQLVADQPDQKIVDEKVEAFGAELTKVAAAVVDAIFDYREVLTAQQRQIVLTTVCLKLVNRPVRAERPRVQAVAQQLQGRVAVLKQNVHDLGLTSDQVFRVKKLMLQHSPSVVRAGSEIVGHLLAAGEELLLENPAKEKVRASAEGAAKKAVEIFKIGLGMIREVRTILMPAQLQMMFNKAPLRLLFGGPLFMRKR